ncbi:MAG: carotenoid 1,2-hydratase [Burkholderiales bacterium]|nr:carotenoid 1,2-hydratase [Burkholderiales bacterium]
MKRRAFLALPLAALPLAARAGALAYPEVAPGYRLEFPRDHGAHPAFRLEWWYVTGWLDAAGEPLGFQVTFFRVRPDFVTDNPSAFVPRQIVVAHAALADPRKGRLAHDERAARAALGLAGAEEGTTRVWVDDWRMTREGDAWRASIAARAFAFDLAFAATRAPMPNGEAGYSRKGTQPQEASYYYSVPQLRVAGTLERGRGRETVRGLAWYDHEWSSRYMAPEAEGWDWTGVNLDDGGALMAFRMRARDGTTLYAGATLAGAGAAGRAFAPADVSFAPLRRWRSPRTGTEYPVAMRVRVGAREWLLEPLMDDQELDARSSTGTIYWEGAVRASEAGRAAGRGYLELTGYWRPMRL